MILDADAGLLLVLVTGLLIPKISGNPRRVHYEAGACFAKTTILAQVPPLHSHCRAHSDFPGYRAVFLPNVDRAS